MHISVWQESVFETRIQNNKWHSRCLLFLVVVLVQKLYCHQVDHPGILIEKWRLLKKKIVCLLCRPLTLGPFSRLRIINLAPNTIGVTGVTKASDFGHSSCLESLKSRRLEWLGSTNFCRWHCGRRSCSGGWCHTISRHHHSLPKCQHIFHREDTPTKCKSALQVPWPLAHKHCHKQLQCCSYWGQE